MKKISPDKPNVDIEPRGVVWGWGCFFASELCVGNRVSQGIRRRWSRSPVGCKSDELHTSSWQEINGCRTNGCIAESGDFGIFWEILDFPKCSKMFQNIPTFSVSLQEGVWERNGKFQKSKIFQNIPKSPDSAMHPYVLHP